MKTIDADKLIHELENCISFYRSGGGGLNTLHEATVSIFENLSLSLKRCSIKEINPEIAAQEIEVGSAASYYKHEYYKACMTINKMFQAATGNTTGGPKRGLIEDLEYVRAERDLLVKDNNELKKSLTALNLRSMSEIKAFWMAQSEWSQKTFGLDTERGPIGPLKHLAKEAVEAQANPKGLMEFVDCLFLVFDATRRAGFTFDQLLEGAWEKLEINRKREWNKPPAGDEPIEHDRSKD